MAEIPGILAPNTEALLLADGMYFCEGPVWDKQHDRLLFSDTGASIHYAWSEIEGLSIVRQPSFGCNGNAIDPQGNLYTCEHETRAISITAPTGTRSLLIDRVAGRRFNSPNDLEVKLDGTIWFTDPSYGLGDRTRELDKNYVFYFNPKTQELRAIADNLGMPNGIAFSPDETKLYVGDSVESDRHIHVFDVNTDNTISNGEVFCKIDNAEWGPDGVDVDEQGNIYAGCGDGVHIFSPGGKLLGKILMPGVVTNFAFGGADGKTLFMTGHATLHCIQLLVAGAVKRW
jgi:gluconolactonase